ncbi:MAG: hypothetical protein LRY55_06620 [Leadbetterella sp.]|nr:hypothetical protein [Leadbetterella sp.]
MYGKYAEGLSAEAMALEVIGVIKGHAKLPGYDKLGPQQQASAADYAKKIGGTLERDGRSMRPDFREFLTEAQQHFTALGELSSFVDTKVTDFRTRKRRLEANPRF